jgi:hypothetical protein
MNKQDFETESTERGCAVALERELEVFQRELPQLLRDGHKGKFVLIRDEEVAGVFPTQEEAIRQGYERYGLKEPFLTKEITDEPKIHYFSRNIVPCPSSPKT